MLKNIVPRIFRAISKSLGHGITGIAGGKVERGHQILRIISSISNWSLRFLSTPTPAASPPSLSKGPERYFLDFQATIGNYMTFERAPSASLLCALFTAILPGFCARLRAISYHCSIRTIFPTFVREGRMCIFQ